MQRVMRRRRRRARVKARIKTTIIMVAVIFAAVWGIRSIAGKISEYWNREVVFTGTIGDVEKGKIPLLLQTDRRWAMGRYGDSSIKESGCAPTALSMVAAGLLGDNTISPYSMAKFAEENGYYVQGTGTAWSLMTEGAAQFGLVGTQIPLTEQSLFGALESGMPVIASVGPGDFTTKGHFIVFTGVENGMIRVNDPNSKKNSKALWDYARLEPQIKNLWSFRVK